MQSVKQDRIPLLTLAIAVLLIASPVLPALAQDGNVQSGNVQNEEPQREQSQENQQNAIPGFEELRQEAMILKQNLMTATENEREALSVEARQLLDKFDRRIDALHVQFSDSKEDMSDAAQQYSGELMVVMAEHREVLQNWLTDFQDSSGDAWDQMVFRLSSAYNSFYESWQKVEANLEREAS